MKPSWFAVKSYDTRIDRFRVRENLGIRQWADEAGLARTQFNKYRTGDAEPRADALADLVRSARHILKRPVRASELFDVGEDEPVALARADRLHLRNDSLRRAYSSRIDELLRRLDLPPNAFAREVALSRKELQKLRKERASPQLRTVRRIVCTLRSRGYEVKASDVVDVGEEGGSIEP